MTSDDSTTQSPPELEPAEKVQSRGGYLESESSRFAFVISDHSLYFLSRRHGFAWGSPWRWTRIPLALVREVRRRPLPTYGLWIIEAMPFGQRVLTGFFLFVPVTLGLVGEHSAWRLALILLLLTGLTPLVFARGHFGLEITQEGGLVKWVPPLLFERLERERHRQTQFREALDDFVTACRQAGLPVVDEGRPS